MTEDNNPLVVRSRTAFPGHAPARGTLPGQEVEAVGADVLGAAAHVVGEVAVGFALLVPPHAPHLLLALGLASNRSIMSCKECITQRP